jgi:hypothetical protein
VPDTVEDRSIRIAIQRQARGEKREKVRTRNLKALAAPLRRKLRRWTDDNKAALSTPPVNVPEELDDRSADSWEPLLAIADLAGGDWPPAARTLAVRFSADRAEEEGDAPGVLLLLDLSALLDSEELKADELGIAGETVVRLLRELPDRPWRTWGRKGDGITETALARLLRPFDVRPELVGPRERRRKRYSESPLRAACARYALGVWVEESTPTLTPSHRTKSATVSDSVVSGVMVLGFNPHTEALKRGHTLTPANAADRPDLDVYHHRGIDYRVGDRLPDGRVVLEVTPSPVLSRRPEVRP